MCYDVIAPQPLTFNFDANIKFAPSFERYIKKVLPRKVNTFSESSYKNFKLQIQILQNNYKQPHIQNKQQKNNQSSTMADNNTSTLQSYVDSATGAVQSAFGSLTSNTSDQVLFTLQYPIFIANTINRQLAKPRKTKLKLRRISPMPQSNSQVSARHLQVQ
jgi:hypothetical protein